MNTSTTSNLDITENYYRAILAKDFERVGSYLHENIRLIGPLAHLQGKNAVIVAAKNLSNVLTHIEIRAKFAHENQIMLVYDFYFSKPNIKLRSAGLMTCENQQITSIELFYDGRPLEREKKEIFAD